MKNYKEIDSQIEQLKAEYHEMVGNDASPAATRKLSEKIKELMNTKLEMLQNGAVEKDGVKPLVVKKRAGEYEAGHPSRSDMRARGETAEEAVDNWNNEVWYESPALVEESEPENNESDADSGDANDKDESWIINVWLTMVRQPLWYASFSMLII